MTTGDVTVNTWRNGTVVATQTVQVDVPAQQQATQQIQQLAATLPATIAQAQADATTIAAMTAGQPPTAEQIAALARHATGWVQLLDALGTLATATGVVP